VNLRQIEVFRAVMSTGSISDAARLLNVSQPGVSRLIQNLERRLGVALFERRKRRLFATPEAGTLHAEIERVYRGVRHVQEVAEHLKFGGQGQLRVLTSANTSLELVPRVVARLVAQFPTMRVAFEAVSTNEIVARLIADEADLAVCSAPLHHPALKTSDIGSWKLLCAIREKHPLAETKPFRLRMALSERLVAYSSDAPQSAVIDGWLDKYGIPRHVVVEVRSAYAACALVAAGVGVAFVDELSARAHGHKGLTFRSFGGAPEFPVCIATSVERPLSKVGKAFAEFAAEILEDIRRSGVAV
jgi:DNA-binding transcriptional LysR family regulator